MKKIVKTIFSNDNRVRRTRDFNIEIYSHDRNNAGFEFVIKNETDLSKYVPKFLFHFLDSRSYWETQGTIEGNKVSVKFDTELITRSEEVLGYLTLDSETDDIDAFKFRFNVVLSEIDKDSTVKKEFRFIKDSVVIDAVTTKELEDVKSKLAERITTLESKADKDTVYDDTDLQKRVKAIEDKPEVDIKNFATKKELEEVSNRQVTVDTSDLVTKEQLKKAFLDDEDREKYAKKTELPQPYNDTDITNRLTALENRPAGSGGNIDTRKFLTKREFEDFQETSSLVIKSDIESFFQRDVFKKDPEKDGYIGKMFADGNEVLIFKGERDEQLEYIYFQQVMRALIDVLPFGYFHIFDGEKITFLTDENFKEMVATPEFKAVVKESLREIVKEIMREEN